MKLSQEPYLKQSPALAVPPWGPAPNRSTCSSCHKVPTHGLCGVCTPELLDHRGCSAEQNSSFILFLPSLILGRQMCERGNSARVPRILDMLPDHTPTFPPRSLGLRNWKSFLKPAAAGTLQFGWNPITVHPS